MKVASLTKPLFQKFKATFVKVKSHRDPIEGNEKTDQLANMAKDFSNKNETFFSTEFYTQHLYINNTSPSGEFLLLRL